MRVRLVITKLPQPVVNSKACNLPLIFIVLLLLKVLTNAPVGVTVDNKNLEVTKQSTSVCRRYYRLHNNKFSDPGMIQSDYPWVDSRIRAFIRKKNCIIKHAGQITSP